MIFLSCLFLQYFSFVHSRFQARLLKWRYTWRIFSSLKCWKYTLLHLNTYLDLLFSRKLHISTLLKLHLDWSRDNIFLSTKNGDDRLRYSGRQKTRIPIESANQTTLNGWSWVTINIYVVHFHQDLIWKSILFDVVELKHFVKVEWPMI